jgi:hypothetical protein
MKPILPLYGISVFCALMRSSEEYGMGNTGSYHKVVVAVLMMMINVWASLKQDLEGQVKLTNSIIQSCERHLILVRPILPTYN